MVSPALAADVWVASAATFNLKGKAMAIVIPFPTAKRAGLIDRTARAMASLSARDGDHYLLRLVEAEFERQERQGIARCRIESDLISFSHKVRAALFREIICRPGEGRQ